MNQMTVNILSEADFDVVVCGGGTAGTFAAVAAAREGKKTVLIEKAPGEYFPRSFFRSRNP